MKTGIKKFITIVGLAVLCAWTIMQTKDISKAEWLIGTWENKTLRGSIYETWSMESDNVFSGISYNIKEKDTVVFENIRLIQEQDSLFYIPIVKNQNDGLAVTFTAKRISETHLVFENKQHDFPQIISYTQISADSLLAEISGIKNGQEIRLVFPMRRLK